MIIFVHFNLLLRFLITLYYRFDNSNNILDINNRSDKFNNILYSNRQDLKDIDKLINKKIDNLEHQQILDKLKKKYPEAFEEGARDEKNLKSILREIQDYVNNELDILYKKLARVAKNDWKHQELKDKLAEEEAAKDKLSEKTPAKPGDGLSPMDYVVQKKSEEPMGFYDDLD